MTRIAAKFPAKPSDDVICIAAGDQASNWGCALSLIVLLVLLGGIAILEWNRARLPIVVEPVTNAVFWTGICGIICWFSIQSEKQSEWHVDAFGIWRSVWGDDKWEVTVWAQIHHLTYVDEQLLLKTSTRKVQLSNPDPSLAEALIRRWQEIGEKAAGTGIESTDDSQNAERISIVKSRVVRWIEGLPLLASGYIAAFLIALDQVWPLGVFSQSYLSSFFFWLLLGLHINGFGLLILGRKYAQRWDVDRNGLCIHAHAELSPLRISWARVRSLKRRWYGLVMQTDNTRYLMACLDETDTELVLGFWATALERGEANQPTARPHRRQAWRARWLP